MNTHSDCHSPFEEDSALVEFLVEIEKIPWFSRLGEQLPKGDAADRIRTWQEWSGPEEPSVIAIHEAQQALYDDLTNSQQSLEMCRLWERIHAIVFAVAASKVPYNPDEDTWHAPNMALWHAAWTAGLVGLCIYARQPVRPELQEQWDWFIRGHWPCDWNSESMQAIVF